MIWPNEHKDTVRKLWELYLQSIYKGGGPQNVLLSGKFKQWLNIT